jgi:hypothetical protein
MSTVGKSQDPPWKDVLYTKGLSAAATILEEYGISCESDMSLVDEDDLVVLCSKLKPFQSKLLHKWVQGLGAEQRAAAFMKDASAAQNHSTSPPLEDKGEEDEDEEENGDEDADADEDEDSDEEDKEVHGGAAGEQGAGDGKNDEDVRIIGQQSAQHHKEDGKRATECVNDAAAAKKAKTSTLSTEQQSFVSKFNPAPAKIDKERKISTRNVKGRLNSLKKQGARLNDVKGATIAKRLQEFSGNFLSLVCSQTPPTLALRNVSSACSMPLLEKISNVPSGTTLSWQCSRSTTNAISEVLLFCVCVCVCGAIYIYMYPLLSGFLPRRALCVCVCVCSSIYF